MNRNRLLLAVAFFACAASAHAQMPQNFERGFAPDKVYQYGDLDHVNHFNGNLVLTVPIGPSFPLKGTSYQLTLVYNSSVWDLMQVYPIEPTNPCYINTGNCKQLWSYPARRFNAGLGWTLSLGRQFEKYDVEGAALGPIYESPDGGDHPLTNAQPQDGSYLRKTSLGVDTPDGAQREFFTDTALKERNGYGWLRHMRDANGNGVDIEQFYDANNMLARWKITDTEQRVHNVYFGDIAALPSSSPPGTPLPEQRVAVTSVVLQGPSGDMTYTFHYGPNPQTNSATLVANSCAGADNTGYADQFQVPLLRSITLPESTFYEATYTGNTACDPAQLESFQLAAVKGQLQWTYGPYLYPDGACGTNPYHGSYGVRERRLVDALGTLLGKWTYTPAVVQTPGISMQCPGGGDSGQTITKNVAQEMTNTVEDPAGMRTIYHFSALPELDGQAPQTTISKTEYGFPMSRLHPNAITPRRYLSTEKQTCGPCNTAGQCDQGPYCTTFEEKYVRYVTDDTVVNSSGEVVSVGPNGDNARIESEQTTSYETGTSESVWTDRSDFDGFGHYRKTTTSGSFGGSPVRETYTNFNPGSDAAGTVPNPSGGRMPAFSAADTWFLQSYDYAWASENGQYSKTEACFDKTHAFLERVRTLKSTGTSAAAVPQSGSDLLAWYTNGGGVQSREEYFGGDLQANLPSGALCGMTKPSAPEYAIRHTYSHGALASSSYYDGEAELLPKLVDRTIDASGVTTAERDSAGLQTTYAYDSMARLQTIQPPGTAAVSYSYGFAMVGVGPIGYNPASITISRGDTTAVYQFDSMGRVWRELHRMPGDVDQNGVRGTFWSMKQSDHDALGRVEWESMHERISDPVTDLAVVPPKKIHYAYAQEGYLGEIDQPDGTLSGTTPSMLSQTIRRVEFTRADGTSQISHTTETRDPLGRLKSISEITYSDPLHGHVTNYAYDLGGHLSAVTMTRDGVTQNRSFVYDQRGFLSSETHPEKGVNGNGTTTYSRYDSRGHAGRKVDGAGDGPFDLQFDFDKRERLKTVTEPDPNSMASPKTRRDVKAFTYGTINGLSDYRAGKLLTAIRHNRDAALGDVTVTETYHYADPAGRLTSRDTDVATTAGFLGASFSTTQQWSTLDQLTAIGYPRLTSGTDVAASRTIGNTYFNGFLTGVGTYASSIRYMANGSPDQVTHGLDPYAMVQKWTQDPDHMPRPCSILVAPAGAIVPSASAPCDVTITGSGGSWNSGQYRYDASGNITQIGTRKYAYDWLNRLAAEWDGGVGTAYGYDGFGNMNMQTITTTSGAAPSTGGNYDGVAFRTRTPIAVDSATNRLNNATFDAAGNATSLPDGRSFEWDSAGAMHALHAAGRDVVYLYTADDERVASVARIPAANLVDVNNRTTWTLRGASNQLLRTWVDDTTSGSRVWSWSEDEIWRGSTLLATESLTGTRHVFTDHLGSPRFMTNGAGQPLGTIAFSSFGQGGATGMGALQFTGHERDLGATSTDALDYMHARYYSAALGRFLSVDPVLNVRRALRSPQEWNRYMYAADNPNKYRDPSGRDVELVGDVDQQRRSLEDLRRTVAPENRIFIQTRVINGKTYVDNRTLNLGSHDSSGNYHTLRVLANSPGHVDVNTSAVSFRLRGVSNTVTLGPASNLAGFSISPRDRDDGRTGWGVVVDANASDALRPRVLAHELVHVMLGFLGLPSEHELFLTGDGQPRQVLYGVVNVLTSSAAREAASYGP